MTPVSGPDEGYPAVYFEIFSGSLGRITFERLDAVKYGRADHRHTTADVPRLRP
jgi:hypothetical protein